MTVKKALLMLLALAVLGFVGLVLINTFMPNPTTAWLFTLITVDAPAYLSSKLEWVLGSIGGIITVAGVASKKISETKNAATEQVTVAQAEANQAKDLASSQFGEVQNLKTENQALQDQITGMQATRTEAEQLVSQQQEQIKTLTREKQEYKEMVEKIQRSTEVVVK